MWPWGGAVRGSVPSFWAASSVAGDPPGHTGSLRGLEESRAAALRQAEHSPARTGLATGKQ